ncbi:MAG: leucine-rich repeat protein [Lachnospiraceae bacterium]|nr:leucine-rich repeat protein [Lachnospiraceae bacterium]
MLKKVFRNLTFIILAVAMILPFAGSVHAASLNASETEASEILSGTWGNNVTWQIEGDLLTISGKGDMRDIEYSYGNMPWFNYGQSLTKVVVEEGITRICDSAFASCWAEEIILPSTLMSIGKSAFSQTHISAIDLPEGLKTVDARAFKSCNYLTELTFPESVVAIGEDLFEGCFNLQRVHLPEGLKTIPDSCFKYCSALTEVNIPAATETIGPLAFDGCSNLTYADLPEGLTFIGEFAFNITGLKEIVLPSTLTEIGQGALSGTQIKTIAFPESIASYGNGVLEFCYKLNSVTLPDNIKNIPDSFFNNTNLARIYLPDGMESIEKSAFYMCTNLASVRIPASVKEIGYGAFTYCYKLTDVYYQGSEEDWKQIEIRNSNWPLEEATIHYNSLGSVNDYESCVPVTFHVGFADEDKQDITLNIPWSDELFGGDATKYHNEMAMMCLVLSGAVELNDGNVRAFEILSSLGFSNENSFAGYFNTEYNYLNPAYVFAYRQIKVGGEMKNLFAIVIRGTTNGSDVLTDLSGAVGGFSVSADNIKKAFIEYVEKKLGLNYEKLIAENQDNVLLITGHSLGGGIANRLSVSLLGLAPKDKSFVYTFAAVQPFLLSEREHRNEMTNVKNIVNTFDQVPLLPPVGYYRIGDNFYFNTENSALRKAYTKLTSGKIFGNKCKEIPFGNFLAQHAVETYMSYLILNDKELLSRIEPVRVIAVECPVDVEVYDSAGKLVGRVESDAQDASIVTTVGIYVEGDHKYIILMDDQEYDFVMTGTDSGEMSYSINLLDQETGEAVETAAFTNVALEKGKTMESKVPSVETMSEEEAEPVRLYVLDENSEIAAEVSPNGEEISVAETADDTDEPETETAYESYASETDAETDSEAPETDTESESNSTENHTGNKTAIVIAVIAAAIVMVLAAMIIKRRRSGKDI